MITQSRLKEVLYYNPDTGIFTWIKKTAIKGNNISGMIAGGAGRTNGYIAIGVDHSSYPAHRLAFLYMENDIPTHVDHKNHIRDDNRWTNLRRANYEINTKNKSMYKNNTSGYIGVIWKEKNKKWEAFIQHEGKRVYLGIFLDKMDAVKARLIANEKYGYQREHGL